MSGVAAASAPTLRPRLRESRLPARRLIAGLVGALVTNAIAAATFWPIYADSSFVVMAVVTGLVAAAIAVTGAYFRLTSIVMLLACLVAFLLLGVPLAVPGSALFGVLPTAGGLRDLALGVALGWKQLLTISLPVGDYQALLVPAFLLILLSVVISLSVALRARRGELAVIPPVLLFLAGTALGPETEFMPLASALAMLAACLLWLVWWRTHRRRESIDRLQRSAATAEGRAWQPERDRGVAALRAPLSALLLLAIAAGAGVAAVTALPPRSDREVLRSAVEQPFDPREYPSPLSGFRSYLQGEAAGATMLTVDGLQPGDRLRIATLDTYDGVVYSVGSDQVDSASGSFTRVPYRLDQSETGGEQATLDVTVGEYGGVWVPTLGLLESIEFTGAGSARLADAFYYNDVSGTAAVLDGLGSGDGYRLESVRPDQPTEQEYPELSPGSARVPQPAVLPEELDVALAGWTRGIDGSGPRLVAMLAGLRENGYVSHGLDDDEPYSRSGHGADRITELLSSPLMLGDGEQYAVAAALMATELGFPSRVVFGFAPAAEDITAGGTDVTGDDISAWVEVDTAQYGWVALDATPDDRPIPEEQPDDPTQVSRPQSVVPPPPEDPEQLDDQTPPETRREDPEEPNVLLEVLLRVATIAGSVLLVAMILLSPFLAVIGAKARRRHRRRKRGSPQERIHGGWSEFRDAVTDHGIDVPATATRSEVASAVGGVQPALLASVADRATFAPATPTQKEADRVWHAVDELRKSLDKGLTRWQRLKARVSLRSMQGYSSGRLRGRGPR
ncbi:transglutaminase domain-containing protein [Desertivibrio insolitus]|uniref:transglutaminase domain-containing protein n=1 Tax=Herbiconiux sp. SYSU D00978 TaxID=2812562 RepID=UPI001F618CE7|nr:transglutaminase domain-containing protein [Herbiconiux sp. SYSU D00978]